MSCDVVSPTYVLQEMNKTLLGRCDCQQEHHRIGQTTAVSLLSERRHPRCMIICDEALMVLEVSDGQR